ncbi:transketolase n-terminal section-related [Holotrichia oblita]|nr:transketolase n-terminal section-related [Holotrichia oblita]
MRHELIIDLEKKAKLLRKDIVEIIGVGAPGHLGGSCSCADIVAALYFHKMRLDPKNPDKKDRDRFLLSKGHAALVQYAALAEMGFFDRSELKKVKQLGAMLQGHPDGLSIGLGMALGLRLDNIDANVYVIIGDGELAEGQIWEAAMAAANFGADNLVAILDRNRLQAMGSVVERFNTNPLAPKWEAFGFHVEEIDGHNMEEILNALARVDKIKGKPKIIIANTVKGKGVSFAENVVGFHNGVLTQENYDIALAELSEGGAAE